MSRELPGAGEAQDSAADRVQEMAGAGEAQDGAAAYVQGLPAGSEQLAAHSVPYAIVGVRLEPTGPLIFCSLAGQAVARGQRVRIALDREMQEAVVVVAPDQVICAHELGALPRVVAVSPLEPADSLPDPPPELVFLPADDADIGLADLARALRLAAVPVPPAHAEPR